MPDCCEVSKLNIRQFSGLTADSRKVGPGWLFAALKGAKADGRDFIPDALAAGAAAIVSEKLPADLARTVARQAALIEVENPRRTLAIAAAAFYGPQPEIVAMVTGTNGKTSTVEFARNLWRSLGRPAASLGTLGLVSGDASSGSGLTTPDPVALASMLASLAESGVQRAAVEASSHGLDQERLSGIRASIGVFTSFGRDHLDYHLTEGAYMAAKMRLFREVLEPGGTAILCADMPAAAQVLDELQDLGLNIWTYGEAGTEIRLLEATPDGAGQQLRIRVFEREYEIHLPLSGHFQALNALAALGIVLAGGEDAGQAIASVPHLPGVPGRMQLAGTTTADARVYIDYAHTPDALATALSALRPGVAGRLVVLFGAGGDRDKGKRPEMGRIAAQLADAVVITDDNPRSEPPAAIRAAILRDCPGATEIGDRREAIHQAVRSLRAGDVLLIAGKGHETGQTIGGVVHPFDDLVEAKSALAGLS